MNLKARSVCAVGLVGLMLIAAGCAGPRVPRRYHGPVAGNQSIGWESVLHGPEVVVRRVGDGYAAVPDHYYPEYGRRDASMGAAQASPIVQAGAWPDRRLDPVSAYTPPRNLSENRGGRGSSGHRFGHMRDASRDTNRYDRGGRGAGGRDFRAGDRRYR